MARRKHRPSDPAEIARKAYEVRRNPALWGVSADTISLPTGADIADSAATRHKVRRVERFDVFALLHSRDGLSAGQVSAIRRLQDDIAIRHRVDGAVRLEVVVDGGGGSREAVTARTLEAGKRIGEALSIAGLVNGRLLMELSEPAVIQGQSVNWRQAVQRVTGEHQHHAQAAAVRLACENLRLAYVEIDRRPRRAA